MKNSPAWQIGLLAVLLCSAGAARSNASLLWSSDFSTYSPGGGTSALGVNAGSLASDSFSATTSSNVASPVFAVAAAPGGATHMSGSALHLSGTATATGTTSVGIAQTNFTGLSSGGGALIVSFDVWNPNASSVTLQNQADVGTSSRYQSATFNTTIAASQTLRFTLVVNRTGATLTLPGSLGTLATNAVASYLFDGTNYTNFSTGTGGFSPVVSGFSIWESSSSLTAGSTIDLWMDNFGVWSSATDTVNGVNVLSLTPGTLAVAAVPEPSTALLLSPAAALLFWAWRRKNSMTDAKA